MKAVIVGASAGLGRALAESLAARGVDQLLVASDERDLDAMCRGLRLTYGVDARYCACHLTAAGSWLDGLREAVQAFGSVDVLLLPVGLSREDDTGTLGLERIREIFEANLLGVMAIVSLFIPGMLERNSGCIVGFGSIAAARGRGRNVAYAAAKRGLSSYFESLGHLLGRSAVRVQFLTIGYMDTQQSFGKKLALPAVTPSRVATDVIARLGEHRRRAHIPRFWAPIELIVRALPSSIFDRMKV